MHQLRDEWAVMHHDGSLRVRFNGRTARKRAAAEVEHLRELYPTDNIRLVRRVVYAGEWREEPTE